jgi:hypothetical protein
MTRATLASALLLVAGLLAGTPSAAASPPLLGVTWDGSLGLVRVEPDTLRPVEGRRVPVARDPLGWSFSPDGSRLALGSVAPGVRLRLVGLRGLRVLGDVQVARRGSIAGTAWAGPRRLLVVAVTPGCCGAGDTIVSGIDPDRRRVLWRRKLGGSLQAGERLRRGLVLVLGPRGRRVGPSRIVLVGPRGGVRSAPLPGIRSGLEPKGRITHRWDPGLAVDRSSGRAFVVQARSPVAEVRLESLVVSTHPVAVTAADAIAGPTRHALWLGGGLLAITGTDYAEPGTQRAAGLSLVDTRRWTGHTIDARATDAVVVSGTLLSSTFLEGRPSGSGLTGFSLTGTRRFHRFGSANIWGVQRIGRNALVGGPRGTTLIDPRTGRRLLRFDRFTMSLLSGDPPLVH